MNAPDIEFKNVSIICNENNRIENVSFRVENNEILVLLGASGQGKSTILQTILNNHRVASGDIFVNGDLLENTIEDL